MDGREKNLVTKGKDEDEPTDDDKSVKDKVIETIDIDGEDDHGSDVNVAKQDDADLIKGLETDEGVANDAFIVEDENDDMDGNQTRK